MSAILRVIVALMLVPILIATFYEGRKVYWDYRVREMCANDGGVTIVEPVSISTMQEKLLPHVGGVIAVAPESLSDVAAPAFSRTRETYIHQEQPLVIRYEQEVVRRLDGKSVAKAVTYVRSGGDIPSPAFSSSHFCPPLDKTSLEMSKVFVVRN